jgi:hypothetical protein
MMEPGNWLLLLGLCYTKPQRASICLPFSVFKDEQMSRTKAQTDVEINTYNKRFFDTYIDLLPIIVGWYKDEVWKLYKDEGIKNWQQFCTSKLSIDIPRLNRDDRKKVVLKLNESGLSTRAIAYVLNIDKDTVRADLGTKVSGEKSPPQLPDQQQRPIPSDLGQKPAAKPNPVEDQKTPEVTEPLPTKETKPVPPEQKPEPDHLELLSKQVKVMKHLATVDSSLFEIRRLLDAMPSKPVEFDQALREYAEKLDKEWRMTRLVIDMPNINMDDELTKLLNQGK